MEATRKFTRPVALAPGVDLAVCVPAHCLNDEVDENETTQDCGGDCGCPRLETLGEGAPSATNADGTVTVGTLAVEGRPSAVYWHGLSRSSLPMSGSQSNAVAYGVSASGRFVVGWHRTDDEGLERVSLWDIEQQTLGFLGADPEGVIGGATGISSDGAVVVGTLYSTDHAFLSTERNSVMSLGAVSGVPANKSYAVAVSADGRVVVGMGVDEREVEVPFRWTRENGMELLGALPGSLGKGSAYAVNADGSVVVGSTHDALNVRQAFQWKNGSLVGLGVADDQDPESSAIAVSASGDRIVGWSGFEEDSEIFIWEEGTGMQSLTVVLAERGFEAELSEARSLVASAVSADGKTIVGQGYLLLDDTWQWLAFRLSLVW